MLQFFERLDLTPEQREQARATVRTAMEAGLRDLVREHARRRRELELLIRDPDVEGSRIIEAARQISASAEQLALRRHEVATSLFRILNEEQKRKARELLAERNRHLRERLDEQPESFGVE
jgi:Spy/CpxP family protein refolding chaperone